MSTIKIKTSHTVETEHEIQIPSYYKCSCYTWKILSEKLAVKVYFGYQTDCGIETVKVNSIFNPALEAKPCDAYFFEQHFFDAVRKLSGFAENGIVIEKQNRNHLI